LLLYAIFGVWFSATVARQFGWDWFAKLMPARIWGLLPVWNFFAPNPGEVDMRLVYRDRCENQLCTNWEEICLRPLESRWRFLWNPGRLKVKALIDLGLLLCKLEDAEKDNPEIIIFSSPYLALLGRVMAEVLICPNGRSRQFAILSSRGAVPPRTLERLFVSKWHDIT
jgi:hypothetical protein